jgi:glycosyltransferase involved in cell wall biosynthesis
MNAELKLAFVQDALPFRGGAEKVLEAALEAFPSADLYTLVYREDAFRGTPIGERRVQTSFIDRLPGARRHHRAYLPLMPLAIEQFDLRAYDAIVSFSYAVAHGVMPRPGQLHISYVHTPMRYAWQAHDAFNQTLSARPAPLAWLIRLFMHSFRKWDFAAAARVDHVLTVSNWMASCIWRAYRRPADVLYPPVELSAFQPHTPREAYYVTVSRLVAHKRLDLVMEAFNALGLPLVVVGEGPELAHLRRLAGPTVSLVGWQPPDRLAEILGKAKAFIHAGEEDFGIAMVEAQGSGCPVIAFGRGSAPEIVQDGRTGLFFDEQSVPALMEAVRRCEGMEQPFDALECVQNAARFNRARFIEEFSRTVRDDWQLFQEHGSYAGRNPGLRAAFPSAVEREKVSDHGF